MTFERAKQAATAAISRRGLFQLGIASSALAAAPLAARGFGTGFTHNVASGEPGDDRVMLWTRYVGAKDTKLVWQMANNDEFNTIIAEGEVTASREKDWCAKGWATGLEPGRWYYYRFRAPDGSYSPIGRTRTLPRGDVTSFKMALFSCSNLPFGWFNAYAHAAEANDVHLALHLGDYIYEYGQGTYPSENQAHPERGIWPDSEIISLADYRLRYATYRADPDLQRIHQVLPMVSVWDDHESTNDSWKDGAQNHQSDTEGDWQVRKDIAKRVYREWMPISDEPYAAYDVGNLATLFRLDTRLEGREEQFELSKILEGKDKPEEAMRALATFRDGDYLDPQRQLLGATQEQWLGDGLKKSRGSGKAWQVLVQQVLIGKVAAPKGLLGLLGDGLPDWLRRRMMVTAMASEAGLPLNMDSWDGYPAARDRLFEKALEADANLLVFAGDTHNGWAFELDHKGAKVGVELGVQSVSSPGFENWLRQVPPQMLAGSLVQNNDQLVWSDTSQRGYCMVELTPDEMRAEYRFMAGIKSRSTKLAGTKRITSQTGSRVLNA